MANAINYAKNYSDTLAQAWPYVLNFGALYATPNNGRFRWRGGKTIEIPSVSTTGRVASLRDSITTATRNFDNAWETKTLSNQRQWCTLIHPQDIDQTNMALTISNITSVFNNEHKFPEMDAYCISKIYADWTALEKTADTTALTAANILTKFDSMMQTMTEKRVPLSGRILYVIPSVMTLLKTASGLTRSIDSSGAEGGRINRTVTMLDGVQVVEVPSELMKTSYTFTSGWAAATDAKQIQMLLIHPESVITPVSYTFAQLDEPSALTGGKYVYFEESFEDVFILNKRADGISFISAS